jgi:pimeloyl-ACP methyl ester carboxylesterase
MLTDTNRGPFRIETHSRDEYDFFGTKRTMWDWRIIGADNLALEHGVGCSSEHDARTFAERVVAGDPYGFGRSQKEQRQ